jgi:hypothetical protein
MVQIHVSAKKVDIWVVPCRIVTRRFHFTTAAVEKQGVVLENSVPCVVCREHLQLSQVREEEDGEVMGVRMVHQKNGAVIV